MFAIYLESLLFHHKLISEIYPHDHSVHYEFNPCWILWGKLSYFGPPLEQLPPYYLKQASPPERCKYNQVNLYFFVFQLPDLHLS